MGLPIDINNKFPHEIYEGVEYKDFWKGMGKIKLDELEQYLVRDLLPASGLRLIDLGCGYGRLSDCYMKRFKTTVLFDGSLSLLQQAREKTKGGGVYIAGNIDHSPFKRGSFDAALMVRVFHHIRDSRRCLTEINRILGINGVLVLNYSNKGNISRIIHWVFNRKNENPLTLDPKLDNPWFYQHHPTYIHHLLSDIGFTELESRGAGMVDKIAERLGPLGIYLPDGRRIARISGKLKIAPWIFCSAKSTNSQPIIPGDQIEDLLQCPSCNGDLSCEINIYTCKKCYKKYPVIDEIIDFRIP
ncbi:MAG TPA: class I SAM-dependent methyltransferase [Prolixibacteraceae bacterium]|jgi:ubiquinone/menaquinone biosynthesis C-methylase UbiE